MLADGAWPARNPDQNLADMRAQIAANEKGSRELLAMCDQFGLDVVNAYMRHVQDHSQEAVPKVIGQLTDGCFDYALDNVAHIRVDIKVTNDARQAHIDFTTLSPK